MAGEEIINPELIIIFGSLFSLLFFLLGILIYRYKYYNLIAGYNSEPDHIKKQYDIEGLAKHTGQGLITLAVLGMISTLLLFFNLLGWFIGAMCLFTLIAVIIPLGAHKFTPEH